MITKSFFIALLTTVLVGCVVPKSFEHTPEEVQLYYQTTTSSEIIDCLADESRRHYRLYEASSADQKPLKISYEFKNPVKGSFDFLSSDLSPILGESLSRLTANKRVQLYHDREKADIVLSGVLTSLEEDLDVRAEAETASISSARRKKVMLPSVSFEVKGSAALVFPTISFVSKIDEESKGVSVFALQGNNLTRYDARITQKSVSLTRTLKTMADAAVAEMFSGILRSWGITTSCAPLSQNVALSQYRAPEIDVHIKQLNDGNEPSICFLIEPLPTSIINPNSTINLVLINYRANSAVAAVKNIERTLSEAVTESPYCITPPETMDTLEVRVFDQSGNTIGGAAYYQSRNKSKRINSNHLIPSKEV